MMMLGRTVSRRLLVANTTVRSHAHAATASIAVAGDESQKKNSFLAAAAILAAAAAGVCGSAFDCESLPAETSAEDVVPPARSSHVIRSNTRSEGGDGGNVHFGLGSAQGPDEGNETLRMARKNTTRPLQSHYPYVVIGAGTTAHAAIEAILQHDPSADILLLSQDVKLPSEDAIVERKPLADDLMESYNEWRRHIKR
jgi:hypothetical protein